MPNMPPAADAAAGKGTDAADIEDAATGMAEAGKEDTPKEAGATEASEFLGLWESLHNLNFNRVQFNTFRTEAGLNRFVMTLSKWIELTRAIGITTKPERNK